MNVNLTQTSNTVIFSPYMSANDCAVYRFISVVFISVSVISFVFNIRFIRMDRHRLNPLVLSLIVNSLAASFISLPYILIQSVKCYPVQSYVICCLQGFVCFTCGVCVMYTMSLLALIQYIRLFYNSSIIYRIFEHKNSFLIPFVCWFISFLWSLPPFMKIEPGFTREGQGFDCSLDWIRSDILSRLYIFLAVTLIYFLPLFCLFYTNIRILITIRKLIHRRCPLASKTISIDSRHRLIDIFTVTESNRLKRLRIDRRFAQATLITILHYLLAWTPYTICGILRMIIAIKSIDYQLPPMLITGSALIAKMAVIGQSCVYFYTVRPSNSRLSLSSITLR